MTEVEELSTGDDSVEGRGRGWSMPQRWRRSEKRRRGGGRGRGEGRGRGWGLARGKGRGGGTGRGWETRHLILNIINYIVINTLNTYIPI